MMRPRQSVKAYKKYRYIYIYVPVYFKIWKDVHEMTNKKRVSSYSRNNKLTRSKNIICWNRLRRSYNTLAN